jgi:hypothetical protein
MSDLHFFSHYFFHSQMVCRQMQTETREDRISFVDALKTMEGLPVWLVIRLCTDEPKVRDSYNQLDSLELSMDVIDDFAGEGRRCIDTTSG